MFLLIDRKIVKKLKFVAYNDDINTQVKEYVHIYISIYKLNNYIFIPTL